MATITVLLREDIESLGGRGEIVKVKAGYARNYLLPRNLAVLATKGNIKQIEQERAALLKKVAKEKATAEAQAEQMKNLKIIFERRAGEQGILFGSVTSMDIAEALQEKGYEIDRKKILLKESIKEIGNYVVPIKLHREVVLELPISVIPEGGQMKTGEEKEAEQKTKESTEEPKKKSGKRAKK